MQPRIKFRSLLDFSLKVLLYVSYTYLQVFISQGSDQPVRVPLGESVKLEKKEKDVNKNNDKKFERNIFAV